MQCFFFSSSNNLDGAVEYLEPLFTSGKLRHESSGSSISFVFRKLIEEKVEPALERCKSAMVVCQPEFA